MIKIVCDRCGAEIKKEKIGHISMTFKEVLPGGEIETENSFENSHFCPACMVGIAGFITNPAQNDKTEAPAVDVVDKEDIPTKPDALARPTKKPSAKRRVDYGKIMALKNAGWSNAKIADEMGMTQGAVATALSAYRKKMREGKVDATNRERLPVD